MNLSQDENARLKLLQMAAATGNLTVSPVIRNDKQVIMICVPVKDDDGRSALLPVAELSELPVQEFDNNVDLDNNKGDIFDIYKNNRDGFMKKS